MNKVDLAERFGRIDDLWDPRIVAAVNDYDVKIAKVRGEFPWHTHDDTDELFLVVDGQLTLEVEGEAPLVLDPGQIAVVPRGRPHRPTATAETQILMLEPRGTRNTGDADPSGTTGEWLDWSVGFRLVGVPFNSSGHPDGVARAPAALRAAGIASRVGGMDAGDVTFAPLSPVRSPRSGLLAEDALVSMVAATREAVAVAQAAGDLPIVLGGDCPVVLGALAATRERHGGVALLLVDGHQDGYPPHASPSGEAADSEVHLALGLPSEGLPEALRAPLLSPSQVTMLGPRDRATLAREGVASLEDRVALVSDVELIVRGPADVAAAAARDLRAEAPAWWLHTDLDVLSTAALPAVDYPQPGGLSWAQLAEVVAAALGAGGCAGWTVTIYNPDLDPDGSAAPRIVELVAGGLAAWPDPARRQEVP